jgi:serine/threonine protein kinase
MIQIGQVLEGKYRVDGHLGRGGMAEVFRGHHLALERDVAIKVLLPELMQDPQMEARFSREAKSASRLDHPNCLRVTDYGTSPEGLKFMIMELLEGIDLEDWLDRPMPPPRAIDLMLQILRGLEHAHKNGIIHRDLKPENVFVTRDHDRKETLKIVDFGIAKMVDGGDTTANFTRAGLIFGTPKYMSPEQATGDDIDARRPPTVRRTRRGQPAAHAGLRGPAAPARQRAP